MIGFIIGVFVGVILGVVIMALLSFHKLTEYGADHREEPPHREPTKLLTVGCSVKYHGRVWEVKRFMVDSENQTIAEIERRDNGEHIIRRTMVPVEELEE